MHKLLITGDRHWTHEDAIETVIAHRARRHGGRLIVICGAAPGADTIAWRVCARLGVHVAAVPALWSAHGLAAGPIRNAAMLALGPDEVVAFHPSLADSKGTADMVRKALRAGVPTLLWRGQG
jgi:glycerate kinase